MPDTPVHDYTSIFFTLPLMYLGEQALSPFDGLIFGTSFLAASLLISPDLDQAPRSTVARRWGFLRKYWTPYGLVLPHRSRNSHSLRGTLIRVVYASPLTLFPLGLLHVPLFPVLLGWIAADLLHYFLDRNFKS